MSTQLSNCPALKEKHQPTYSYSLCMQKVPIYNCELQRSNKNDTKINQSPDDVLLLTDPKMIKQVYEVGLIWHKLGQKQ